MKKNVTLPANAEDENPPPVQDVALPPTPMGMLDRAVASGASIEVLERLMGLQERFERNLARREFDAAIASAKAEIPPIIKNRQGHNAKKYADFAAIARTVDPIISAHGLSYRFRTQQADRISVTCILSHRAGHFEETTLSGPADTSGSKNAIQAIGSTLSYLQRYSLIQMLELAAAEDDDGNASGKGDVITDEQVKQISDLVTETKTNIDVFLKWAGVECIPDITASAYANIIAKLEHKKTVMKDD